MMASTPTMAPNAHSKSPIALFTMSVALTGLSKRVTGTLFGALTSSNRSGAQATSDVMPSVMRILSSVMSLISVDLRPGSVEQANGEHERRELGILGLVHEIV